jgi:hypothetical protein
MKATINLEFTDEELTRFAERWANKLVINALNSAIGDLGDLAKQAGPLIPIIMSAVTNAVAGRAGAQPAPRDDEPICDDCEEQLKTECVAIKNKSGSKLGWVCHQCRWQNGMHAAQCSGCSHKRCGAELGSDAAPAQPVSAPRTRQRAPATGNPLKGDSALYQYRSILGYYPADRTTIIVQEVIDGAPKGEKTMLAERPANEQELASAVYDLWARTGAKGTTTYAVSFFDDSKSPLGEGTLTIQSPVSIPES